MAQQFIENFPGGSNFRTAITPFERFKTIERAQAKQILSGRGLERVVRPAQTHPAGDRLLDQLLLERNKPGESTEATITWGAASNFDVADARSNVPDNVPTVSIHFVDQPQQELPPDVAAVTLTFNEVSRKTHKVRVENPDDSSQWVEVENTDEITFDGPDHIFRRFIFKNQS